MAGNSETELCVLLVVADVSKVVDINHTGIFATSSGFVIGLRDENWLGPLHEMNSIGTFCIADARRALGILGAVENDDFSIAPNHGRIERTRGFQPDPIGDRTGSFESRRNVVEPAASSATDIPNGRATNNPAKNNGRVKGILVHRLANELIFLALNSFRL